MTRSNLEELVQERTALFVAELSELVRRAVVESVRSSLDQNTASAIAGTAHRATGGRVVRARQRSKRQKRKKGVAADESAAVARELLLRLAEQPFQSIREIARQIDSRK